MSQIKLRAWAKEAKQCLEVIERIEEMVSDEFCHDLDFSRLQPERMTEREKECTEKLSAIYRYIHSINPNHSCYSNHADWREEFKKE